MNILSIFEDRVSNIFGATRAPFSFKKLAKQAAREMEDQTLVVHGVNTAPALYTVLIAQDDDPLLAPYYPQLSREINELVKAQAEKKGYRFVGEPLVRFMIDPSLRGGKFSVFAENVKASTLGQLYEEERAYQNGLSNQLNGAAQPMPGNARAAAQASPLVQPQQAARAVTPASLANIPTIGDDAPGDPFSPDPFGPAAAAAPISVPQTVSRSQLAGMGGAAATGAAMGTLVGAGGDSIARPQQPVVASAQLIDVVTGEVHTINQTHCIIGRERTSANVVLRDPNVSRRHAELSFTGSDWSIEDLNSTNGTLVNNRRVTRCPLRDGDLLTFGLSTFEFRG